MVVDHSDDMKDIRVIEESLEKLNGVFSAKVNLVTGKVKVDYDPERLTFDEIRKKVENFEIR